MASGPGPSPWNGRIHCIHVGRTWVSSDWRPLAQLHVPGSSLLSPALRTASSSTAVFPYEWCPLNSSLSKTINDQDWTFKDRQPEICRLHAPHAPRPHRHRMADTTRLQDNCDSENARVVEPASLATTYSRIGWTRKLQLYALLGKIGGVKGVEGSQRVVGIMIIGGFPTSS